MMEKIRVLIAEDDALIGLLLGEMLESMNYDVCAIVDTEVDAVKAAARCEPQLMIVDQSLAEGDGLHAVETICGVRPVAHVFVSGDVRRLRSRAPDAIIVQKPYRTAELVRAIAAALATPTPAAA